MDTEIPNNLNEALEKVKKLLSEGLIIKKYKPGFKKLGFIIIENFNDDKNQTYVGQGKNMKDNFIFEGSFGGLLDKYNKIEVAFGKGKLFDNSNRKVIYDGEWENNKKHGKGTLFDTTDTTDTTDQSVIYDGQWENNKKHGKGTLFDTTDKSVIYDGQWDYGKKHGVGKMFYIDNSYYEGDFKYNKRDGFGTLYDEKGTILQKGNWSNGVYQNTSTVGGYNKSKNKSSKNKSSKNKSSKSNKSKKTNKQKL